MPQAKQAIERALDALNFFLADVLDGLGPYLAIYLLTEQKWDQASIGVVMSVAALAGIIAQTPMGRFGRPEELIGAVRWLCGDGASFVTGAVIPVDGGYSLFGGI